MANGRSAVAQNEIGQRYANGKGVPKDYVTAYAWFSIAAINGNALAKKSKPIVAEKMTPTQITKAEALAKEMIKMNPKLIKK